MKRQKKLVRQEIGWLSFFKTIAADVKFLAEAFLSCFKPLIRIGFSEGFWKGKTFFYCRSIKFTHLWYIPVISFLLFFFTQSSWPSLSLAEVVASVDIASFQSRRDGAWFNLDLLALPETQISPEASFIIKETPLINRKNGQIAPTLLSSYFYIQWNIASSFFEKYAYTIKALFLRSALMSFVDYPNNRVLGWWRESTDISTDVRVIIRLCNKRQIPVFLEINYSDYIPGPPGSGVESLRYNDNIESTIAFLRALEADGLRVDGISFGDQIEDDSGFGPYKPTIHNSDLIGRFINYARALKSEFPELKIYAFDSDTTAIRGRISQYWEFLKRIKRAEMEDGRVLLDGFTFTESYVYIDENNNLLESQFILDDTESLYRDTPVYRYDVWGNSHPNPDRAYLPEIIEKINEIFGRPLDIGITEYLPAGPYQISESDTSRYSDIDFIIHFSDIVGIYAQLGLDFVAKMMFGDHVEHSKSYFDRNGNLGINYLLHEQLAQYFSGKLLNIGRSHEYDNLKVKVYAARQESNYFVMILNKDVNREIPIRITLPERFDLKLNLPRRSYTSIIFHDNKITVSGIGN